VWNEILSGDFSRFGTREISPLLTTNWNQDWPYNQLCPVDNAGPGGHVYAGCVATAMSMVMKYWNWPVTGQGSHGYTAYPYGYQSVSFANTTYLWDQMPNAISLTNDPIARLMYHCGVAVNMDYAPDGSGAQSADAAAALRQYFRYYTGLNYVEKQNYTQTTWDNLLREQLDNVHPLYYSGGGTSGGHAWACDGYQGTNYFHFNWGWGGWDNGYFYSNALNTDNGSFNQYQGIIINVHPANYGIAACRVSLEAMSGQAGSPLTMYLRTYPILTTWNVQQIQFVIEYDPQITVYNGFDLSGTLLEGATVTDSENEPGRIIYTVSSSTPIKGPGILLKPLFTPLETSTYVFNIGDVYYNTTAVTNVVPLLVDVTAQITQPQNSVIDILNAMNVTYNTVCSVPVTTTYLMPSWQIASLSFQLHYPPAKLQWEGIDTAGCLLAGVTVNQSYPASGLVNLQANLNAGFYGEGTLLKFKFRAIGNTQSTSIATLTLSDFFYNSTAVLYLQSGNVVLLPITDNDDPSEPVLQTALLANTPNPFRGSTSFCFSLKSAEQVTFSIFNQRGQRVRTLTSQPLTAGQHVLTWDGCDTNGRPVAEGIYYYKMRAGSYSNTRKMLILK